MTKDGGLIIYPYMWNRSHIATVHIQRYHISDIYIPICKLNNITNACATLQCDTRKISHCFSFVSEPNLNIIIFDNMSLVRCSGVIPLGDHFTTRDWLNQNWNVEYTSWIVDYIHIKPWDVTRTRKPVSISWGQVVMFTYQRLLRKEYIRLLRLAI